MLLSQIFLHQEVKRNQNITKGPFLGGSVQKFDLSVNPQPPKDAYTRFSGLIQFQVFFDVFLLFLDIKSKFIEFTSSRQFLQWCVLFYLKREVTTGHSFFNCTGISKRSSLSHHSIIQGDFFTGAVAAMHSFRDYIEQIIFDSSYLLRP